MDLIQSLGLDYTIAYQILIFLVAYIFLSGFLFKPYLKAHEKREEKTYGQEDLAEQMDDKTQDLNATYKDKQRELNSKMQAAFQEARDKANSESKEILDRARTESENSLSQANQKVSQDIEKVRKSFPDQSPEISQVIVEKLVGRNI